MWRRFKRAWGWFWGIHICEEFTQWETYKARLQRPVEITEYLVGNPKTVEFTKRWQERRCTICGKMEQRNLEI